MKNLIKIAFVCGILLGKNPACANLYRVENVPVVAERSTALAAKEAALSEGQVVAFQRLIRKLSPDHALQLPQITEETVLPYVLGVSIENEKTTATKYMGSIAVEFNPSAVKELLNAEQVTYLKTQAPTLLVIPEYVADGKTQTLEMTNPLYQALKDRKNFASFYQAVVPNGTENELALTKANPLSAAELLPAYGKEKIMVLRLVQESADMWQMSTSFNPSTGMQDQVVYKRFRFAGGDPKVAAGQMADAVFQEMETRWRADKTTSLSEKQTLYIRVPVNSLPEWLRLETEMKTWNFWEDVTLKGVYLPQVLVEVTYKGSVDEIAMKLAEQGWTLKTDLTGNGASLTRIKAYE